MHNIDYVKIDKYNELVDKLNLLEEMFDEITDEIHNESMTSEENAVKAFHDFHALQRIRNRINDLIFENDKLKLNEEEE